MVKVQKMKLAVLVVTYNRLELLKECLDAVIHQTVSDFDILIVDNASGDGTFQWIESLCNQNNNIECIHAETNMGGAGGFSLGIKFLTQKGYDTIWLMDDDTMPREDALEQLLEVAKNNDTYGFLVSRALWKDGTECIMNRPLFARDKKESEHVCKVQKATFVSMLLPTRVVKDVGLPYKEFFIWGDDQEYTARITEKYEAYQVKTSEVIHKSKSNVGSDVAKDEVERIPLYFYSYRNEMFISRQRGILSILYYLVRLVRDLWRVIVRGKWGTKRMRLKIIVCGFIEGIRFTPKLEMINL